VLQEVMVASDTGPVTAKPGSRPAWDSSDHAARGYLPVAEAGNGAGALIASPGPGFTLGILQRTAPRTLSAAVPARDSVIVKVCLSLGPRRGIFQTATFPFSSASGLTPS
jgi:hypothetical protein